MLFGIYNRFVPLQVYHRSSVDVSPNGDCLMLTIASCNVCSSICSCLVSVTCTFDQIDKQGNIVGDCKG